MLSSLWTRESTSDMVVSNRYYYAVSTRVAMRTGSSTLNFLLGDHLGSQSITTNSSGSKTGEIRYFAWGTERYTYGTTPTTYHFTGQKLESSIGLYFYGTRWYDPSLGRFIQPDSVIPDAGNSQAFDRYAYVLNNPLKYTDPSGNFAGQPPDKDCGPDNINCGGLGDDKTNSVSLTDDEIKYLVMLIWYESSSGGVPNDVSYMKTWALLNKSSFDAQNGKNWSVAESWGQAESGTLDLLGFTPDYETRFNEVVAKFKELYAEGKSEFISIVNTVKKAVNEWQKYGSGSWADPVHGATGFVDMAGMRDDTGTKLSERSDFILISSSRSEAKKWSYHYIGWYPKISRVYNIDPLTVSFTVFTWPVVNP